MGEWNGNRNDYHGNNRNNWGDNRSNNNGRHSGNNSRPRKRSGSTFKMMEDGVMVISAWKKNRYGYFTLYGRPYKGTKSHVGERSNKEFLNYFVTVTNMSTGNIEKTSGLYYPSERKLRMPGVNQVVTPNGSGGYWGKSISKTYNRR